MTLVEVMIAAAIGGIVIAALASLTIYTARSIAAVTNYVDMDQYSRKALDRMTKEIRQADSLSTYSTSQLVFNTAGGANNLTYAYNQYQGTLTRTYGSEVEVLLKGCDSFTFTIFARNTISNSFDQFPTTNAANAKLVKMDWLCTRTIFGQKVNTESIQSAKIVMRKP